MERIAILGCGSMGRAILVGLGAVSDAPQVTVVSTRRAEVAARLTDEFGVRSTLDNVEAVGLADAVVLAVKPQIAGELLSAPGVSEALDGKLLISICAGLSTAQLAGWLPSTAIIRAMPNTPCLIREGMTVLCAGPLATDDHIALGPAQEAPRRGDRAVWKWSRLCVRDPRGPCGRWRADGAAA